VNSSKTSPEFGNNTIEGGYDCYPALFDTVWLRVSFRLLLLLLLMVMLSPLLVCQRWCSIKCSTCTVIIVVQVASHFFASNIWLSGLDTNNAKSKQTEE